MEEQKHIIDLAAILDNPLDYTEEELRDFFADGEHREEYIAVRRARQAARRQTSATPDVEKEWQQFSDTHFEHVHQETLEISHPSSNHTLRYLLAAMGGAAAMLVAVLLFTNLLDKSNNDNLLTVMEYDDGPQQITMVVDGKQERSLKSLDSVSFYSPRNKMTAEAPISSKDSRSASGTRMLKTPRGMDLKVILPDGSEVWLNAESSLEFPTSFSNSRKVILNGEAYFKVARDESKPFIVSTDKMHVKVLGTEFNFRHYDRETAQVSLIKGAVEILHPDNTPADIILHPGQGANMGKDGEIKVHEVDTYAVTQWISGFFYFQNQSLVNVLREIGRWYNVGVVFENPDLAREKIHFSALRKDTLQQTIDNLNHLMNNHLTLVGNNIVVR